MLKIGRQK